MTAIAKTRADGEGSVYQDGSHWVAAVSYRDPATGQRKRQRVKCRTKPEARKALQDMRRRADADQPMRDATVTLAAWSQRWEQVTLAASQRRATTKATYGFMLKSQVRPYLGGTPLAELRPSSIEQWLLELDHAGLSSSTRRQALTVLRAVLDDAVRDGLLASSPALKVTRPTLQRTEAEHYSPGQVGALLAAAEGHRLRPFLMLLAATGLRRGEALALRWEQVDLARGELKVRGTLVRTSAGLVVHPPKTRNGWRTVPLSAPAHAALTDQRRRQLEDRMAAGPSWIDSGHVFATEAGTPLDPNNVAHWFTRLVAKAGTGGSLHTMRHTALTRMILAGVPMHVVSRIAGHESMNTTSSLYGHMTEDSARDAVTAAALALGL